MVSLLNRIYTQALGVTLATVAEAVELRVRGRRTARIQPKTMYSLVTLSGTAGQVVEAPASDLRNSRYPFVALEVHVYKGSGATEWKMELHDRDSSEVIFGAPDRVNAGLITRTGRQSTGLGVLNGMECSAKRGGFRWIAESAGTNNIVAMVIRGYWKLPLPEVPLPSKGDMIDPEGLCP